MVLLLIQCKEALSRVNVEWQRIEKRLPERASRKDKRREAMQQWRAQMSESAQANLKVATVFIFYQCPILLCLLFLLNVHKLFAFVRLLNEGIARQVNEGNELF